VPKKILRPDAFQEFELKEKTVISHNVAMYANAANLP
jgi:cytochrome-b5 reductase